MSIQFNDTTNLKGLAQFYERELGFDLGYITGNTQRFKEFTADVNVAFDDFVTIAIPASGTWQFDDSNQTDYPIITTNIVANQRDYSFTTDESGNLILDIYRVFCKPSANEDTYDEIYPIDQQSDEGTSGFWDGQDLNGIPYHYDKTANGIFLDPVPDYNSTNGLKVMINRESSYFTTSDTTKKPGVPGLFHSWFYKKPALEYAKRKHLSNTNTLFSDVVKLEENIEAHYAKRSRDERDIMTPEPIDYQ